MTLEVVKMSSFLEFSLHFYNSILFEKVFFSFKVVVTGLKWCFLRENLDCWK